MFLAMQQRSCESKHKTQLLTQVFVLPGKQKGGEFINET